MRLPGLQRIIAALSVGVLLAIVDQTAGVANPNDEWFSLQNLSAISATTPAVLAIQGASPAPAGANIIVGNYSYTSSGAQTGDQQWRMVPAGSPDGAGGSHGTKTDQQMSLRNRWSSRTSSRIASGS